MMAGGEQGQMRVGVVMVLFGIFLAACAEAPQQLSHTLRPSVPWPDTPKPVERAAATHDAPQRLDAMPISSYAPPTDAQVQAVLIERSIASFSGGCPCPYSTDRSGQTCGDRSAYSRADRPALLCYPRDVPPKMIADYRARMR
jgi:hypothetical protein